MRRRIIKDEKEERRHTKRLFLYMVISALICCVLGVFVLLYFFAPVDRDTHILTVPGYVGVSEKKIRPEAEIALEREWIYSDDVTQGIVISQTPYAGARRKVKDGEKYTVTVYISLGRRQEKIPELSGVEEMSAAASLRSLGVRVRSVPIYSDKGDGLVISTSPLSGSSISCGDTVTMYVSRKRVAAPVCVPDFSGLELKDACRLALEIGLFLADDGIYDAPCDIVIYQSIAKGALVRYGSYISFMTENGTLGEDKEREWPPMITESDTDKRG